MKRQSNFELLRIICMVMVVIAHCNYGREGFPTQELVQTQSVLYFWRILVNQLCTSVGIPVFIMLSGWFGIKASWKGFAAMMFQVGWIVLFCWGADYLAAGRLASPLNALHPLLFGDGYWFVVTYMILFALSPVLNSFAEHTDEKTFRNFLLVFYAFEIIYGFLLESGGFGRGYSALHFIGLYLLARYVRLFPNRLFQLPIAVDLAIWFGTSLLSTMIYFAGMWHWDTGFHLIHGTSPLFIIGGLYCLLAFSKMKFQSRLINWMAVSVFSIYLIQENLLIKPYFLDFMFRLYDTYPFPGYLLPSLGCILLFSFACILADQPRVWLWNKIKKSKFLS